MKGDTISGMTTLYSDSFSGGRVRTTSYISAQTGVYTHFVSANNSNLGGAVASIEDIGDVAEMSPPPDNSILTWDAANGYWSSQTAAASAPGGTMTADIGGDNYSYGISSVSYVSSQKISGGTITGLKPYMVYDNATFTLGTTPTVVNLDTEHVSHSNYSLAGDAVTVSQAGTYMISYSLVTTADSNEEYTIVAWVSSTSVSEIVGSYTLNGNTRGMEPGSCATTIMTSLSANDKVCLMGYVYAGGSTITSRANTSHLTLLKVG
jgi:hypothetical protein